MTGPPTIAPPIPPPPLPSGVWAAVLTCALLGAATSGCKLIKGAADLPGDAVRVMAPDKQVATGPAARDVQMQLLRFGDEHVSRFVAAVDLADRSLSLEQKRRLREVQVTFASDIWAMASGQNAYANLLDLVVVLSLARSHAEQFWIPETYGEAARPVLDALRESEQEIWRIAGQVLTPTQQTELRHTIDEWRDTLPNAGDAMFTRALGLADTFRQQRTGAAQRQRPDSVFSFLMIDPLAGLDPATRELTEARMFAERALYVAQRMPFILRWQSELLVHEISEQPRMAELLTNAAEVAHSAERLATVSETLPDWLSAERQAVLDELRRQADPLTTLTHQIEAALAQGNAVVTNATATLETFERVLARFPAEESPTNAVPFRIQDYTEAAATAAETLREATTTLERLDVLLRSPELDQLANQLDGATQRLEAGGRGLLDHAFQRALLLILAACGGLLITLLLYRALAKRFFTPPADASRPRSGPAETAP